MPSRAHEQRFDAHGWRNGRRLFSMKQRKKEAQRKKNTPKSPFQIEPNEAFTHSPRIRWIRSSDGIPLSWPDWYGSFFSCCWVWRHISPFESYLSVNTHATTVYYFAAAHERNFLTFFLYFFLPQVYYCISIGRLGVNTHEHVSDYCIDKWLKREPSRSHSRTDEWRRFARFIRQRTPGGYSDMYLKTTRREERVANEWRLYT